MLDFAQARRIMVDSQVRTFDVNDIPLLATLDEVPRERFVPAGRESLAYCDLDLPVAAGGEGAERRLMLKPMVLARMMQMLEVVPGMRLLDVACGLGYSSAVLARLGASVVALESDEALAQAARERLEGGGVRVVVGPLEAGYSEAAPYDAILVNGMVEVRPERLLRQLAEGGRLACIERTGPVGRATLYVRSGEAFSTRTVFDAGAPVLAGFKAAPGFTF